jgi:hypothetical protein
VDEYDQVKERLRRENQAPSSSGRRRVAKRFTNEIGNPISIRVEETTDTGVTASTGKKSSKFDAIKIVIEGPTSISENTITRQEAAELLACLKQLSL